MLEGKTNGVREDGTADLLNCQVLGNTVEGLALRSEPITKVGSLLGVPTGYSW